MENPEEDGVFLHSFRTMSSTRLGRDESVGSEQTGQGEPEPDLENRGGPTNLASIEFRMQHLHSRRLLLLKMKRCTKKEEQHNGRSMEERIAEDDDDDDDELRAIQKELEELQVKKEELERATVTFTASPNGVHQEQQPSYRETPCGGIYMLPPAPPPRPAGDAPAGGGAGGGAADGVRPAESLGKMSGVTQCPSCKEVVVTETHSTVSETMWILCFLCSILGCVAGCCLVPFRLKRLRSVHHHCPGCKAKIHTHQPL